jgi:hypothetical protein
MIAVFATLVGLVCMTAFVILAYCIQRALDKRP